LNLKYAWFVVCVSLVATKAAAAIPDSTGVFHGCYNVLTGSTRLIDGTNCGLLERHVAWQQTGLPGPQGPQGPQGPAGPSGSAKIIVGFESFGAPNIPHAPNSEALTFATSKTFTAAANGTCNIGLTAFVADDALPLLEMYPTYLNNESTWTRYAERAELIGSDSIVQGSTVVGIRIDAGHTYTFGLTLKTYEDAVSPLATAKAAVTWTCVYD
jgi:hypothetical protein